MKPTVRNFSLLLIFLLIEISLVSLGLWQWHRGDLRSKLSNQWQTRAHQSPTPIQSILKQEDKNYYTVQLSGHFDNDGTVLVDNQTLKKQPGYAILTPFILDDSQTTVLVNRGWASKKEKTIQPIHLNQIKGIVYQPVKKPFTLNKKLFLQKINHQNVVQNFDIELILSSMNLKAEPFYVWLTSDQMYHRDWKLTFPNPGINYGYALQYFVFAIALAILFFYRQFKTFIKS